VLDLLCQKLADQALHLKDLVKEAIEPGGMAKLGAEYSGDVTPTSEDSSEYSASDGDLESSSSDFEQNERFPIMLLPVEVCYI